MTDRPEPASLSRLLAIRMAAVSVVAVVLLFAFFFFRYTIDTQALRLATLQAELATVHSAVQRGEDPARLPRYQRQPAAYAFRVFDRRSPSARKVVAEANTALFQAMTSPSTTDRVADARELDERFDQFVVSAGGKPRKVWMLTDRVVDERGVLWVQVAMTDDPDRLWLGVIGTEMIDHVGVPALVIVPLLAVAMLLATSRALRPLQATAARAEALGEAVASGRALELLPAEGLPKEIRQVVDAMNAMLAKLELSMERQRQFTANASHEIRTPLSVALLEVAQLPDGPIKARVTGELEALRRTVNQFLRFAQAEDAISRGRTAVDVAAVARHVCEDLASQALEGGQEIAFEAPDTPVMTLGNADLVDVAIRNVVENALRHSPQAGTVVVTVAPGPRVIVEDSGPGVPDGYKDLIFQRLWRADSSRPDGAGIGLALARQIAALHDGGIEVEDRAEGGARFVLRFRQGA